MKIEPTNKKTMTFFKKGRYAVYVGNLPRGCNPTSPTELPSVLDFASVLLAPVSPGFGQRFCRAYNARQLTNGIPGRRWALVAMRAKSSIRPCKAEDCAVLDLLDTCELSLDTDCPDTKGGVA